MKLDIVSEFRVNELEVFAWISMGVGMLMFLGGIFWDKIAGIHITHRPGFGWMQIAWCAFWGLYTFYGWAIQDRWGE